MDIKKVQCGCVSELSSHAEFLSLNSFSTGLVADYFNLANPVQFYFGKRGAILHLRGRHLAAVGLMVY